jgi:hypothetical protein
LNEKEKAEWFKLAWFTAILLSPYKKRGQIVDPEDLLPSTFKKSPAPMTKEEAKRELEEIKKSVGIK